MKFHIRTIDTHHYIYELHGTVFISWVEESHKKYAKQFQAKNASAWFETLSDFTEKKLELVVVEVEVSQ